RFKDGIVPNPGYSGLYPYGAEIRFRRWGKLESVLGFGAAAPRQLRRIDRLNRSALAGIKPLARLLQPISPRHELNSAYALLRQKLLRAIRRADQRSFEDFVVEVWNLQPEPVRLIVEYALDVPKFRTSLLAEPGRTMHRIPVETMKIDLASPEGLLRVYPEND